MKERNYKFDNMKLVLIILVILGHLLELFKYKDFDTSKIYLIIYTFHMPLFIFLSGMFAKFNKKKIFSLIFTYAVFQVLYRKWDIYLFTPDKEFIYNYTTPYWLLWFVFTITLYTIIIPLIDSKKTIDKTIILSIIIWLSLIVNKAGSVGYYASISRFFTFLPYFVLGYYAKDYLKYADKLISEKGVKNCLIIIFTFIVLLISNYVYNSTKITPQMLYGSYSYESAKYGVTYKAMFFAFAIAWILFFYLIIPSKKIKFITILGSNTFTIYLFHGFYVKYLEKQKYFIYDPEINIALALLIALIITLWYGNKYIAKFLRFVFCGELFIWIYKKIFDMKHNTIVKGG